MVGPSSSVGLALATGLGVAVGLGVGVAVAVALVALVLFTGRRAWLGVPLQALIAQLRAIKLAMTRRNAQSSAVDVYRVPESVSEQTYGGWRRGAAIVPMSERFVLPWDGRGSIWLTP
ncbi:hypothetical protein D3C78_1457570 [compost metagenome]